jgi:TRAP-type C4-dicarboxylate transport system substrate-binding protein
MVTLRSRRPVLRQLLALVGVLATLAPSLHAQDASDKPKELRLTTAVGPAFALGKAGLRWAQLVAERSGGTLAVVLHPGAVLAQRDPTREFAALRNGTADLAIGSTLNWSTQVNELAVIGLPWLAPEAKQLDALVIGTMKERLIAAIERRGAVPLAFAPLGHRELATVVNSVRTPDDLAGLRVRTVSTPFLTDLYAGLRARPEAMAFAAAQAAFNAGTLDAQDGTLATFAAARLDAVGVKHVTLWGAVAEVAVFAVNRAAWNGWTEDQRSLVSGAAQQAAQELPSLARAENDAALAELRKRGLTIVRLTATGRAAFAAAARPVYDKWAGVAGDELVRAAEVAVKAATP